MIHVGDSELRELLGGRGQKVAGRLLQRLDARPLADVGDLIVELQESTAHGFEFTEHLLQTYDEELASVSKQGGDIIWSNVGDPCWHAAFSLGALSGVLPSTVMEYCHDRCLPGLDGVVYEVWVSHLWRVFADHWYCLKYEATTRSVDYAPIPASLAPELAVLVRQILRGRRYTRVSRRKCARRLDFIPPGLSYKNLRFFDLLFTTMEKRRLLFTSRGYGARRLRIGSTHAPPAPADPAALLAAIPGFGGSWREERDGAGCLLSRELTLALPPATRVHVQQIPGGHSKASTHTRQRTGVVSDAPDRAKGGQTPID